MPPNDPGTSQWKKITFLKDELVKIEESLKVIFIIMNGSQVHIPAFCPGSFPRHGDAYTMFTTAGLRPVQKWTNKSAQYSLWLLERPQFSFPHTLGDTKLTGTYYSIGVPLREEWRNL